jgi:uridylate kinase
VWEADIETDKDQANRNDSSSGEAEMIYKRVLLKLSGGAIGGTSDGVFDADAIKHAVGQILSARDQGVEIAVVVGGGNIFRGRVAKSWQIERPDADNIGMLATLINAVMLRAALKAHSDYDVRVMSAFPIPSMVEPYIRLRADRHLERGAIVILGGGNGQPFVTTDYPAVQRAVELQCDAVLAAKAGVDGVFTADPNLDGSARKYATLSYDEALQNNIRVMDQSALLLARDHEMPVHVFGFDQIGSVDRICRGERLGTLISIEVETAFDA